MSLFGQFGDYLRGQALDFLFPEGVPTMDFLSETETKEQSTIVRARKYYEGRQEVKLTDRQKEFLRSHTADEERVFTVNHCPTIVDAVVERMHVSGVGVTATDPELAEIQAQTGAEEREELAELRSLERQIWLWWQQLRMDAKQIDTHRRMVRDGEAFILIDWDEELNRPEWFLHPRYTDPQVGGDGFGMWMEYPNNDPSLRPRRAYKQWWIRDEDGRKRHLRNIYEPNRVIHQVYDDTAWVPFTGNGSPIEPWTVDGSEAGDPIGIPVAHFRNPNLTTELNDVFPLQDTLNKTWLDVLAAADTTAFRMLVFLGWIPTTDGEPPKEDRSNLLTVMPGQTLGTEKRKDDVGVDIIEPADLKPLLDVEERVVYRMATVTDTPLSRFQSTRQIAAEGTLKQQEGPLVSKVKERMTLAGNAYEDAIMMSLRLANIFGDNEIDLDGIMISTEWDAPETRDESEVIDRAATKHNELKVPLEKAWEEAGYSKDEINRMMQSEEVKAVFEGLRLAQIVGRDLGDRDDQTEDEGDDE